MNKRAFLKAQKTLMKSARHRLGQAPICFTFAPPKASLSPVSHAPSGNYQAGNVWEPFFWKYIPRLRQGFEGVLRADRRGG